MKIATLVLSGSKIKIGNTKDYNPADDAIWFKTDEQAERTFISVQEAKLLICAIEAAIGDLT